MDKNPKAIRNIVIVGGGTAGWMSAAYLNKALNASNRNCKITLIEASDIPTVGVGEATLPKIRHFFNVLDISEAEWMRACNATYKMAIKFTGWYDSNPQDIYWHTFGQLRQDKTNKVSLAHYWLKERNKGYPISFAESVDESVQLCEANKSPKIPSEDEISRINYAYHLDAGLLATFLKEVATERGVQHLVGKVKKVNLNQEGFIQSVDTDHHGRLEGDLFIDCSGFGALLIEKALKEPWVSYADSLLVDSAVAISCPYLEDDPYNEQRGGLNPYTSATAQKVGWTWHTPLITRDGNGYVYSSQFASKTDAETEFRQFLGEKATNSTARHIKMRIGKFKRSWVKNCVSIGLSGGFIEPLESTGIALIQFGIQNLVSNFPDKSFDEDLLSNYNRILDDVYEHTRDFIILHYRLTQRKDTPFWSVVKNETTIPDSLQERLEAWKHRWPKKWTNKELIFEDFSYASILSGMNYLPEEQLPILDFCKSGQGYFNNIRKRGAKLAESHPTQAQYFKYLYSYSVM